MQKNYMKNTGKNKSMLGKWDGWYKNVNQRTSFRYGNTITYQLSEDFLKDLDIEDWGAGTGAFKRIHTGGYTAIDGSKTPFTDKVADLRLYKSRSKGIFMRHVLEHNYDWKKVLKNAVGSFTERLAIVIFTPFASVTHEIAHNAPHGVDVPDMSFKKSDIEEYFKDLKWQLIENLKTKTGYGVEHVYLVERIKK